MITGVAPVQFRPAFSFPGPESNQPPPASSCRAVLPERIPQEGMPVNGVNPVLSSSHPCSPVYGRGKMGFLADEIFREPGSTVKTLPAIAGNRYNR